MLSDGWQNKDIDWFAIGFISDTDPYLPFHCMLHQEPLAEML